MGQRRPDGEVGAGPGPHRRGPEAEMEGRAGLPGCRGASKKAEAQRVYIYLSRSKSFPPVPPLRCRKGMHHFRAMHAVQSHVHSLPADTALSRHPPKKERGSDELSKSV